MKCSVCGTELPETINVCPVCGNSIEEKSSEGDGAFSIDDVLKPIPAEVHHSEILKSMMKYNPAYTEGDEAPIEETEQSQNQMNSTPQPHGYGMKVDQQQPRFGMRANPRPQNYNPMSNMQQPNPAMRFSPPPVQNMNMPRQAVPSRNVYQQKKKSPLLVFAITAIVVIAILAIGSAVLKDKPSTANSSANIKPGTASEEAITEINTEANIKAEYNIGETWTVDGQWSLTILGAKKTDDRNQFSDKNPSAVYIIDYTYTNNGYEESYSDGLYISLDDMIVDNTGKMGYSYPGNITYHAQETPIGATCTAQTCIGVDNDGVFKITVNKYDNNFNKYSATFVIDPSIEAYDVEVSAGADIDDHALAMGETWTVDGQWSLTITGVTETNDRNEYSDKTPDAVYIVDYTYSNLGFEDKYMDGLYINLDDTVVDCTGKMGYSYPGHVTNHPQEVPVGATCEAQVCVGVDNAGDFRITISKYDDSGERQSETFLVNVE